MTKDAKVSAALLAVTIAVGAASYWLPDLWAIVALVVASLSGTASLLFAAVARARRHQRSSAGGPLNP